MNGFNDLQNIPANQATRENGTGEKLSNAILQYVLFSLVKELRGIGFEGQIREAAIDVQLAMALAMRGAITVLRTTILGDEQANDPIARNWEINVGVWSMESIFGKDNVGTAKRFVQLTNDDGEFSTFFVCGTSIARNILHTLNAGGTLDSYLETHQEFFVPMCRLFKKI
jgi:hypothetical protein